MRRTLTPLFVALGFLTRLPVPRMVVDDAAFAAAIRCYPLVGAIVGVVIAGVGAAAGHLDAWTGALAALVAWVVVTGGLHLDGLADLADGCGAAHRSGAGDAERLLAVMADPHVGSFGAIALVLQLVAKLVLLHGVAAGGWWPLILVPFAARIAPLAWAHWLPPLRPGLGASITGAARRRDLVGWGIVLAAAAVISPSLLALPVLALGYGLWLRWRLGGITGDCHGAGIELIETGLLLALLVARTL